MVKLYFFLLYEGEGGAGTADGDDQHGAGAGPGQDGAGGLRARGGLLQLPEAGPGQARVQAAAAQRPPDDHSNIPATEGDILVHFHGIATITMLKLYYESHVPWIY